MTEADMVREDADTPEEVVDEMKWGNDDAKDAESQREDAARIASEMEHKLPFGIPPDLSPEDHHAIARRALFLGTALAVASFVVIVACGMLLGGFYSISSVLQHVGSKDKRNLQRLLDQGEQVVVLELDLSDAEKLEQQVREVMQFVEAESNKT